jgi:pyrophosphatase PpaX
MPVPAIKQHGARAAHPLAVLFDLDGTLIDSIELILSSMRHAFAACGRSAPADEEWLTGVGIPLWTMFARYAVDEEQQARLIAAYRQHQLLHHDRMVQGYEGVAHTLARLHERGHPLGVVTSKADWLAERAVKQVQIDGLFATIVGCDSCSRHKPHPEPVLTALERLGYSPEDALFVGDSVHDIAAGNAAGVITVAALWGPFSRQELAVASPAHYLESISVLPALVERLARSRVGSG